MKKLLLIGAMLVLGATSFSEVLTKLEEDNTGKVMKYSGSGKMEVTSKGRIIDPTNRLVLVVEPAVSTGADHTALAFEFGKLTRNDTRIRESEFIAQVLKNKTPIPILKADNVTPAISSEIVNGNLQALYNDNRQEIGTIAYALSGGSGLTNNDLLYKGRVKAEIATGRNTAGQQINSGNTPTGTFTHSSSSVKVIIDSLNVSK